MTFWDYLARTEYASVSFCICGCLLCIAVVLVALALADWLNADRKRR